MEVGLLGPVLLRVDGATVAVPSAPQRIVLARMVLAPANTATVAALVDAVWAGNPPANADNNLQIHISRLRKAVGADRIRLTPGGYRLAVDDTDIAEAERLVAAAGCRPRDAAVIGRPLDLWRGEPCPTSPTRWPLLPSSRVSRNGGRSSTSSGSTCASARARRDSRCPTSSRRLLPTRDANAYACCTRGRFINRAEPPRPSASWTPSAAASRTSRGWTPAGS